MSQNSNFQDKKMHPDDKKNMVIFFVACVALFFLYDTFIYKPKMEALKVAQEQAELAANSPDTTVNGDAAPLSITREEALTGASRVTIESDTLSGSLNLNGGRIDDLSFKNYQTEPGGDVDVTLLSPKGAPQAYYGEFGWLSSDQSLSLPGTSTKWTTDKGELTAGSPVTLRWNNGRGLTFTRTIALDDQYMFTVTQGVTNNTGTPVTLYPFALIGRDGMPLDMARAFILHEGPIGYVTDELFEADYGDLDDGENTTMRGDRGWVGITDKYWLTAIMPSKTVRGENKYRFIGEPLGEGVTHYQADMMGAPVTVAAGATASVPTEFFAGPKIVSMLEEYAAQYDVPHFDLAVDFGVFYFLTRPFYEILTFLNDLFGNFAVALLVFTVLIKLLVFPLAQKSYRSFARMRKVTPQMVELREKFGDDRAKLQAAIFELYKKENVNPMAGCFPILIQIPIFFALYKVFYVSLDMRHEPFWGWVNDMSAMDPTNIFEGFGLFPWGAPLWLTIGAWPIIMGLTMALQQRLSPPPQDGTQKFIMSIMPFWLVIILAKFPAGLVIYWSWSNTLSILQQYVLLRQEGVRVNIFTRSRSEEKLEELIEEQNDSEATKAAIDHDDIEPTTKVVKPKKRKRKK
jgi:YidC/Oxa1 family membrane protein insertase